MIIVHDVYENGDGSFTAFVDIGGEERVRYVYRASDPYAPAELHEAMADRMGHGDVPALPQDLMPSPEPELPTIVYPADLWRRSTDVEAEAIDAAMQEQPLRIRKLFQSAQTYQSDDLLWPTLEAAAVNLFGEQRAAELLAPS